MGVASAPDIAGTAETRAAVAARDARIAKTKLTILDMQNALEDARDFDDIVQDAEDVIAVAAALLATAERDLEVTVLETAEANRLAQDAYLDAEYHWREVHDHYLGIDLTADELHKDPDTLFGEWGVNLETLFDSKSLVLTNNVMEDDPATRWERVETVRKAEVKSP